jgi:hypothetical protein
VRKACEDIAGSYQHREFHDFTLSYALTNIKLLEMKAFLRSIMCGYFILVRLQGKDKERVFYLRD